MNELPEAENPCQSGSTDRRCHAWRILDHTYNREIRTAIDALGSGLTASAASSDGIIEAVEMADKTFMVGVQFHPEYLVKNGSTKFLTIFSQLVKASQ